MKQERPEFSILIPTLDEAPTLGGTLERLRALGDAAEIIVVDGGSTDGTLDVAQQHGVWVLEADPGRGPQLRAAAAAARGEVLWILHADTLPPRDALEQIRGALRDPAAVGGCFRIRFDGTAFGARFLNRLYPWLRFIGICYGDSAIFVRREAYDRVDGIRPFPIFEDLDLVGRLRRTGRFVCVQSDVVTSSRRFEGRSFALTFTRWAAMQVLYWLGVSPRLLGRLYRPIRGRGNPMRARIVEAVAALRERSRTASDR